MTAVLAGCGAALAFAASSLCAAAAAPLIGPWSTVAWSMLVGLAVTVPIVALQGLPGDVSGASWALLALIGVANPLGLGIQYLAYRSGKVAVVAAVVSTEGAIAALLAVATGEVLGALQLAALLVVAGGVFASALAPDPEPDRAHDPVRAVLLALVVAGLFGAALFSAGRVGAETSVALVLIPARLAGTLTVAAPLALRGRLRITRRAAPFVVAAGLAEVAGVSCVALGSGTSLAVTAVVCSQWAALTALGAYLWLGQRLGRTQLAGIGAIAVGVGLVTASVTSM